MSICYFIATEKPLQKTIYEYKDILPAMMVGDMFYDGRICFEPKLTEQERHVLGNIFGDFNSYAVYSDFQLYYSPEHRQVLSERFAQNALSELLWLKSFIKKKLLQQDIFMLIKLCLGEKTNFNALTMQVIDINTWELSANKSFEFESGIVYQFVDNSEEAVERRISENDQIKS